MTHPFHPQRGRSYALESCRMAWGERRVYFYDEEGDLQHMPAAWTDVEGDDPFVAVAKGRACSRLEDLLRLSDLMTDLEDGR